LLFAGGVGLLLFHSRKAGATVLLAVAVVFAGLHLTSWLGLAPAALHSMPTSPGLRDVAIFFFEGGAFTFGGGLSMIAFIQEQIVNQFHWLTASEFIDGLALGQLTPGPILMLAAYVGYKVAGFAGAAIASAAIFLPSFMLMLSILPVFNRVRKLVWTKAAMKGVGPAVIGALTVSLFQLAPYALPDMFAVVVFLASVIALLGWRTDAVQLMIAGSILGVLHSRLASLVGASAAR
jgi:chromate transporter